MEAVTIMQRVSLHRMEIFTSNVTVIILQTAYRLVVEAVGVFIHAFYYGIAAQP